MPDPKKIKKLEADVAARKSAIQQTSKLAKDWGSKTGPVSTSDEKILASGAHGVHGKVNYEKALISMRANLTQAKSELAKVEKELEAERAK